MRRYIVPVLACAMFFASGGAALAAVAGEFGNYCAMGLANGQKKLTDCSISEKIDGKTYCFGNNAAKTEFMKDPTANIAKAQENFSSGN
jgi:YHS domain-containing protein